jgi:hypothetical protein
MKLSSLFWFVSLWCNCSYHFVSINSDSVEYISCLLNNSPIICKLLS